MNRIGLIGTMSMEIAPLLDALEEEAAERIGAHEFRVGTLRGIPVVIGSCGVGKVNAALGAQAMMLGFHPKLIVHMGVGGSLTKQMEIGDVMVARDCVQYDVDTTALGDPLGMVSTVERIDFPCDVRAAERVYAAALECCGAQARVLKGRAATGDRFLTRPEDKAAVVKSFGALTCDQESCAIAQACWMWRTPVAVIRAVSDVSDGAHEEEYQANVTGAADIAAGVALRFVEKFGREFI